MGGRRSWCAWGRDWGGGFLLWDWRASHEGFYFDVVSCVDGALKAGVVVTFAAIVALPQ